MLKLLFLDTLAINRAPTAAYIFHDDERFEARYAGTSRKYALYPVTKRMWSGRISSL
ncbi:hypothetical protein AGMMS49983_10130 [Clostridia bacterium]|nr:hypothetical protein AGMMS49983_10130 [Clostridia bacterium]